MYSAKTLYGIILFIALVVAIFSIVNFAYFIQIYNDENPDVSSQSSIGLIVINGLLSLMGLGIVGYCIWNLLKKPAVEAKIFQHYRRDVDTNAAVKNAIGTDEPAVVCNELNRAVKLNSDGSLNILNKAALDKTINGFQNLGLNIYEFVKECDAEGLTEPAVMKYLDESNRQNLSTITVPDGSMPGKST